MALSLEGKKVLVTGASSGIGAALAEALAIEGAVVGICARRKDRLAETLQRCKEHSPDSRMWVVDLSVPDQVDGLASSALEELGGVDILVNNAGIPKRRHVTELDPETVESVMAINYLSPVRLTLALLPHMLDRGTGLVVNVASVAATLSSPGESAYDASKAALAVFSESMAIDLWDTGVSTMVVYPGLFDTELFSLPDNNAPVTGIDPAPVSELVEAVMEGLHSGARQVYAPAWFADIALGKVKDLDGFLAGAAAFIRDQSDKTGQAPKSDQADKV
jgi:NAD(P)-dependent dehydrogenase (short-subunit alcohol dehydrogenase family)